MVELPPTGIGLDAHRLEPWWLRASKPVADHTPMRTKLRPITAHLHQSQNRLLSSAGELETAVELGAGDVTGTFRHRERRAPAKMPTARTEEGFIMA